MTVHSSLPSPRAGVRAEEERGRSVTGHRFPLPVLYLALGHLCLGAAAAALALDPAGLAGFYYHPRLVAAVHLVTLGWISAAILGALYMIGPLAMRMPMAVRAADLWAFAAYAVGVTGMVAHFWIAEARGMAWAALLVAAALLHVGRRALQSLRRAPIQPAVKLHIQLAFLNLALAATSGLLLAANKVRPFLPGHVLSNVAAHAHLAALGWALMMVMGFGYRLLPMLLPAAMPQGRRLYASAVLLEAGLLVLVAGLVLRRPWAAAGAVLAAGGVAAFLAQVVWMVGHPRPAPAGRRRPDFGVLHAAQALAYLGAATILGLALVLAPPATWKLQAALVYGVAGLLGFLAQMVLGVHARLLPIWVWLRAYGGAAFPAGGLPSAPPTPHQMPPRRLQWAVLLLWSAGVPLLAVGLARDSLALVAAGGWSLLGAVAAHALVAATVVLHRRGENPVTVHSIRWATLLRRGDQ